jgi:hypothetical protein
LGWCFAGHFGGLAAQYLGSRIFPGKDICLMQIDTPLPKKLFRINRNPYA